MGQALPPELRRQALEGGVYGELLSAIDRQLLASIYDIQYVQSVKQSDQNKWEFQIKFQHKLVAAERTAAGQVRLSFQLSGYEQGESESNIFDLVIAATGHERTEHRKVLQPLNGLLDGHQITVNRDYELNFRSGACAAGCGIWLQSALEGAEVSLTLCEASHNMLSTTIAG